ncbi:MAG: hypothetical protein ABH869_01295 [Candidatus Omnitrophota bacterium]
MRKKHCKILITIFLITWISITQTVAIGMVSMQDDMTMGMSFSPEIDEKDLELCPEGIQVVDMFLKAWQKQDFRAMYSLIDEKSRDGYDYSQAQLDFQFMEYKDYKISSVKKSGEDFEFYLSYGDWRDGDKDLKKVRISGKTFKIIMLEKGTIFKRSVGSYF